MKKPTGLILTAALLLLLCILAALLLIKKQSDAGSEVEQEVRDSIVTSNQVSSAEPEESKEEETEEPYVSPVDFAALQAVNPDIYAWLDIPNTDISYPLVQRDGDDSFYLNHNSSGDYDIDGALFTEQTYSSTDFTEPVTAVYGHQAMSGNMFGKLQMIYSDPAGITDCGEIVVYLPDRELHFTVFAAVPYDNRHILYTYNFESSRMYNAFLDSIYSVRAIGAVFNEEATAESGDKLLILSTCLYGNSQKRYLVLAKCVEDIN